MGHEVAAADAEHAELVAVLLVDRVHVAELDRAEAAAQAEEGVSVSKELTVVYRIVEVERLLDLPDRRERAAELFLASEAEVRVRGVDVYAPRLVVQPVVRNRRLRHQVRGHVPVIARAR